MEQTATWKTAVVAALQRFSKRNRTRQIERGTFLAEELPAMVSATGSAGRTPAQTVSRVLQELRDEGHLFFSESGVYVISGGTLDALSEDFPEDVLEHAAQASALAIGDVAAFDAVGLTRLRRGMAAVRRGTLLNYRGQCALCDISDSRLLVASHIARWADRPDARGLMANVICLCKLHDPLFESGYFSLSDEFKVLWRPSIASETIRQFAQACTGPFRLPLRQAPTPAFLQEHRTRVAL
ncbi:MAG: hypothetical protein M9915_14860 [Rhizobacter sp.]|nr:hypothetical protein [Burkholderiaceae bacterium]MCO5125011.1 hypothetical protein [Rhizobacter sp.]